MQAGQTRARDRILTIANGLTLLRLAAVPALYAGITGGHALFGGLLFGLAVATDLADGRVARARGENSAFGGFLDHATDASFVSVGLYALALQGVVPLPLPFLVAAAFLQYTLDSRAHRGRALRASWLGRWNGIAYFVLLGIPVVGGFLALVGQPFVWLEAHIVGPPLSLPLVLGWLLVATTCLSMADRAAAQWSACRAQHPLV